MKRTVLTAAIAFAAVLPASELAAQACIGVPIPDRAFAVEGAYSITDGGKGYGGALTANLAGPLSVQAEYTMWDLDELEDNANSFGGLVAYELAVPSFSLCPVVGAEYMKWSAAESGFELDISELTVPIGFGVGTELDVQENMALNLFAIPQFLYMRATVEGSFGGMSESETESSNEFGSVLGARLGLGRIHLGAAAFLTSVEDSDPVFTLSLAYAFGGAHH